MSSKVSVQITLTASESGGDQVKGTINETIAQDTRNKRIQNVQTIGLTSEAIVLGDVAGHKILMFENLDPANPCYIDTANPATTSASIKLGPAGTPSSGVCFATTVDAWFAIATGAPTDVNVTGADIPT